MDSEERNAAMDTMLAEISKHNGYWVLYGDMPTDEAVRECDRKARAWDALQEWVNNNANWMGSYSGIFIQNKVQKAMSRLLPSSQPKDPLDELETELKRKQHEYQISGQDALEDLCACIILEIRRLRGKE